MKKHTTCAIVIADCSKKILGCHATGRKPGEGFDFPKGMAEENEEHIDAAVRELLEETNLTLDKSKLTDLGIHKHNQEKDIHIFIYLTDKFPDISTLKCNSFFELNKKTYPEVNSYEIITPENRYKFNKVLQNKFSIIDNFIDNYVTE